MAVTRHEGVAMELTPIRVIIGLKKDGGNSYPDFNKLPEELRDGMDWCRFVDRFGGWYYNKVSDHQSDDDGQKFGTGAHCWCGLLMVPDDFAQAAVNAFPGRNRLGP